MTDSEFLEVLDRLQDLLEPAEGDARVEEALDVIEETQEELEPESDEELEELEDDEEGDDDLLAEVEDEEDDVAGIIDPGMPREMQRT